MENPRKYSLQGREEMLITIILYYEITEKPFPLISQSIFFTIYRHVSGKNIKREKAMTPFTERYMAMMDGEYEKKGLKKRD